jgi:hypothetical protein
MRLRGRRTGHCHLGIGLESLSSCENMFIWAVVSFLFLVIVLLFDDVVAVSRDSELVSVTVCSQTHSIQRLS